MEQHPRIELGFQVYETCTSPFMFMRQKLTSQKGSSLPSLAAECVLTLHHNLSKWRRAEVPTPNDFTRPHVFKTCSAP